MRILIAYDGSASADAALEDLGRAGLPFDADACVLSVASGPDPRHFTEAYALAERAAGLLRERFPQWTMTCDSPWGPPAKVILDVIQAWNPNLVILGSHGRTPVGQLLLGSTSVEIIHKAPCVVRVGRHSPRRADRVRIVIGNDGSTEAMSAVREVARRPWPADAEVNVVCAMERLTVAPDALDASTFAQEHAYGIVRESDEHERSRLTAAAEEAVTLLRNAGLNATFTVVDAEPSRALIAQAEEWEADSIFVGARGLRLMDRLVLGSVSTRVVTHAQTSVEVVRTNPEQ